MTNRILLVDDEPNILQSMQRQLRKRFDVVTAESGKEALDILASQSPFSVIVSDMRMPGMDGVQLLSRVKSSHPETVRIMLTGNVDQETAAEAVNEGHIFRFLTKPCSTAILISSLVMAVRQYELLTAEKELLDKTVKGSVAVMAELLSLANATAFSSGYRMKPIVKYIVTELNVPNPWMYEVAAMVSQIGCITLPSDVLHKVQTGIVLQDDEMQMYKNHPKVGSRLIQKVPRLEKIAAIIERQFISFDDLEDEEILSDEILLGAGILKAVIDYDLSRQQDMNHSQTIKYLWKQKGKYNPEILNIIEKYTSAEIHAVIKNISFKEVVPGMFAVDDVFAKNGTMLIPKNQEITWSIIQSLSNFEKHIGIIEPIRVRTVESDDAVIII